MMLLLLFVFKYHYFQTYSAIILHFLYALGSVTSLSSISQLFKNLCSLLINIRTLTLKAILNSETLCTFCILLPVPNYCSSFTFCCSSYEIIYFCFPNKKWYCHSEYTFFKLYTFSLPSRYPGGSDRHSSLFHSTNITLRKRNISFPSLNPNVGHTVNLSEGL